MEDPGAKRRSRLSLALLTAFGAAVLAGLLATGFDDPGRSSKTLGETLLLAATALAAAGVLLLPGAPRYLSGQGRTLVDGLIVGGSFLLVAWELGLQDLAGALTTTPAKLALAHAVGFVVLAAMLVVMATRATPHTRGVLVIFALGFSTLAVGDAYSTLALLSDSSGGAVTVAALWPLGGLLIAVAAIRSRAAAIVPPGLPTRASVLVPSLPFAAALAAVAGEAAGGGGFDDFVAWNGLAVALLIVSRQILALLENISFWRNLEAEVTARTVDLERSEGRFRSLVQNSSDVITAVDAEGVIRYQSPSVEKVLGYSVSEIEAAGLSGFLHPDDEPRLLAALAETRDRPRATQAVECRVIDKQGRRRYVEAVCTNLLDDPDVGAFVLNIRDITERKALEEQLTHLALHDPLTGLANRALFGDRLQHAIARAGQQEGTVAVLFLDLDDFKRINDTRGHGPGDELLAAVAARLADSIGPADTVARLGGDEFAILLDDVKDELEPARVGERILKAFDSPLQVGAEPIFIRASIGIAMTPSGGQTADDLLRNADIAMYTAKAHGKGMYELFEDRMRELLVRQMQLETDLREALDRGELTIHYQPIVALGTGTVRAMEALIRWRHPSRGWVPPAEFIPLAEQNGMIIPLGQWVLETACRQVRSWQVRFRSSPPLSVCVNLSAKQLQMPEFADRVTAALRASGLHPASLVLEITETTLIEEEEKLEALDRLRALGVKVALDDFGTGYSSLSYLQRFPLTAVKIDRVFVAGLTPGSRESAFASGIVSMADTLGLRTIAEGVEGSVQLMELRRMGCDQGQGNYFAKPLSASEIERWLAAGREQAASAFSRSLSPPSS